MGDCFYILMVHVEGLISRHSMGKAGSHHTKFKEPLQSRLNCFCLRFLFGALKGVNKTFRTNRFSARPIAHELGHHHSL